MLAVSRVDYRPTLTELLPWQAQALAGCGCPRRLGALAEDTGAMGGQSTGAVLADLMLWLPAAQGLGLVAVTP